VVHCAGIHRQKRRKSLHKVPQGAEKVDKRSAPLIT
jgi:hypothetical protein